MYCEMDHQDYLERIVLFESLKNSINVIFSHKEPMISGKKPQ